MYFASRYMNSPFNTFFTSPIGIIEITANDSGITAVTFCEERSVSEIQENEFTQAAKIQLQEYFLRERTVFTIPLSYEGTPFQKTIWNLLCKIPYGSSITYAELSHKYGNLKAIRAVGAANGANPIAILIPCHRVIGKNGKLVGYAGGIQRKEWLLQHEGVTIL